MWCGRRRRGGRKSNLSGVNAYQIRELQKLIKSYNAQMRGRNRRRRRSGVNQKGGFIAWLAQQLSNLA